MTLRTGVCITHHSWFRYFSIAFNLTVPIATKIRPNLLAPTPRSRLSGAERRAYFLDMAAGIIVESGVSAVTMEAVAARSDVDKRLGYRYFANRDDLIGALVEREFDAMRQRVHAELPTVTSFDERVRVNARLWLATIAERGPLLRRLLYGDGALEHYASTVRDTAVADWGSMIASETGLEPTSAATVTRMLLAALSGAIDAVQIDGKPLNEVADFYSTIVLAGIHALKPRETGNEGKDSRRRRK